MLERAVAEAFGTIPKGCADAKTTLAAGKAKCVKILAALLNPRDSMKFPRLVQAINGHHDWKEAANGKACPELVVEHLITPFLSPLFRRSHLSG